MHSNTTLVPLTLDREAKKQAKDQGKQGKGDDVYKFTAVDVACGPYSTWVVGSRAETTKLKYEDDEEGRTILKKLRNILLKEHTLVGFFGVSKILERMKEKELEEKSKEK